MTLNATYINKKYNGGLKGLAERSKNPILVKVGVVSGAGVHPESDNATYAEIAFWLEFGTPNSRFPIKPIRFLHRWGHEHLNKYRLLMSRLVRGVLLGKIKGDKAKGILGAEGVADLQRTMDKIKTPPNSLATQLAKGEKVQKGSGIKINNPTIDTGRLRNVMTWAPFKGVL